MADPDSNLWDLLASHTEAWNRHDLETLMSLFAEDCVFEASGGDEVCGKRYKGHGEVKQAFAAVLESMPDAQWSNGRHYRLAPDYGVSEWTLIGTLPDGRRLEVNGCDFLTVRDGKIVSKNSYRKHRPPIQGWAKALSPGCRRMTRTGDERLRPLPTLMAPKTGRFLSESRGRRLG